jgi:hypothetical protein
MDDEDEAGRTDGAGGATVSGPTSGDADAAAPLSLPASLLRQYRRFTLYNSPYPAHDRGCAVDLYPETNAGRSPVAGEVRETRVVRAPPKPYAHGDEYLILVDVDVDASALCVPDEAEYDSEGYVARILHVRPEVSTGDRIEVGDSLGEMVRSGFFAPWVDNHVHVGFRRRGQNVHRARGSLPLVTDVAVEPLRWDGVGTVVETGETYAVLDAPAHPNPGEGFVGLAADDGTVVDGGLPHYAAGGVLADGADGRTLSLLGHPVGTVRGRDVAWRDVEVVANGRRITGLSLFADRTAAFGAKLVCPDQTFAVGDEVRVTVRDTDDPIRLG